MGEKVPAPDVGGTRVRHRHKPRLTVPAGALAEPEPTPNRPGDQHRRLNQGLGGGLSAVARGLKHGEGHLIRKGQIEQASPR